MRKFVSVLAIVVTGLLFVAPDSTLSQERNWQDSTGNFSVQAELVDVVDGKVWLKKQNGKVIKVPIERLSKKDQAYLEDLGKPKIDPITAPKVDPPMEADTGAGDVTPQPVVVTRPKKILKLDASHFDSTDIPPRPNRKPVIVNETAGVDDPAGVDSDTPSSTGSQPDNAALPTTENSELEPVPTEIIPDRDDVESMELPTIEINARQINSLPNDYLAIGKALFEADNSESIRNALTSLDNNWPSPSNETILDLVRQTTSHDEKFCRLKSLKLLGKYDFRNSLPFILARMNDSSFDVRWATYDLIAMSPAPHALQPLIDRFTSQDQDKISSVLAIYGPQAEKKIHPFLSHPRAEVRMEASLLLGKIGTEESIPLLAELMKSDKNPIVRLQAKSSLRNIKKRLDLE